jgi:hypothetical protein
MPRPASHRRRAWAAGPRRRGRRNSRQGVAGLGLAEAGAELGLAGVGVAGVGDENGDRVGDGDGDGPAGFGPDGAARVGVGVAPAAGAGGDHRESAAALGHQVQTPGGREGRAALVGDRDPGHAVPREADLDDEHAAVPRGGVRDRVRAELRHAGHEDFAGRTAGQQFSHEPACLGHGRGCAAERPGPGTRRLDRTRGPEGTHAQHRVGTSHCRSPPDI